MNQRYQLDLSDFFSDHRQKVFVGKRDKWKQISCLVKHVGTVFGLSKLFITNGDGVLFLEDDNLDVIRESDLLRVHSSNSSKVTQQVCAPKRAAADDESRASVVNQNGKRKRDSISNVKPIQKDDDTESSSESDSDDDDDNADALPKIFVELESIAKKDDSVEEIPKPKRKRIRKRKYKKKKLEETPQKVVVKTYGKGKVPAIINENGNATQHIRFSKDEAQNSEDEVPAKDEPYRNLNKTTIARVVKAVLEPSKPMDLNDACPSIPDYVDDLTMDQTVVNSQRKQKSRKQKKPVEIKQELIDTNTNRAPSPTWDTELDQAKESFLSNYTGEEFWATLQEALDNFPTISIPSVHDIISYRLAAAAEQSPSYLAFVERADDGDSDDSPALKLKLRQLNTAASSSSSAAALITHTLDQLTDIRLVAAYQP